MIRSPGLAKSIADWMVVPAAITVGVLPPIVTVTVSTDLLPLAAVMASSPQRAELPVLAGVVRCAMVQVDTEDGMVGTVPVIWESLQETFVMGTPAMVTFGQLPVAGQVEGLEPKP